jgi:hypothetical protein
MQVSATVVPAEASWSGFSAAQELAASAASEDAGFDVPFARIELSPSSGEADRRTISILYLLN